MGSLVAQRSRYDSRLMYFDLNDTVADTECQRRDGYCCCGLVRCVAQQQAELARSAMQASVCNPSMESGDIQSEMR